MANKLNKCSYPKYLKPPKNEFHELGEILIYPVLAYPCVIEAVSLWIENINTTYIGRGTRGSWVKRKGSWQGERDKKSQQKILR